MGLSRDLLYGICIGAALATASCASFAFKYYGLDGVSYADGKLLGPEPKDDLPFSRCEPDPGDKGKCVVMFGSEFFALKLDYQDTKNKLKRCERECQGP